MNGGRGERADDLGLTYVIETRGEKQQPREPGGGQVIGFSLDPSPHVLPDPPSPWPRCGQRAPSISTSHCALLGCAKKCRFYPGDFSVGCLCDLSCMLHRVAVGLRVARRWAGSNSSSAPTTLGLCTRPLTSLVPGFLTSKAQPATPAL